MDGLLLSSEILLTPEAWAGLFFVAMLAGFIDSIAGGGGLLTVPALLATGLSPAQVLATNKLQSVGGSFSASLYFVRRKAVSLREQKLNIALTFIGAVAGAVIVQRMNPEFLRNLLPLLVVGIGLYFLFCPQLGDTDRQRRLSALPFGVITGIGVGFYDGMFGPGAGSFYALCFVGLCGYNLTKATAHAKVLNFTSNFASLIFFILGGKVVWLLGLLMMVGQFIGARLGARMVLTRGKALIRPMIVIVSLLMSCKLLYESHGEAIHQYLLSIHLL